MPAAIEQRQRRVPVSSLRLARAVDRALTAVGRTAGVVEVMVNPSHGGVISGRLRGSEKNSQAVCWSTGSRCLESKR